MNKIAIFQMMFFFFLMNICQQKGFNFDLNFPEVCSELTWIKSALVQVKLRLH